MDKTQMSKRVPGASCKGKAHLRDHRVVFHKRSVDGTGKANIVLDKQNSLGVWGIAFEVTKEQLKALAKHEVGYFQKEVIITLDDESKQAITFVAEPKFFQDLPPSAEYLQRILDAAKSLPPEYQAQLRDSGQAWHTGALKR
jgi:gamma-glutamylcyclotransferase